MNRDDQNTVTLRWTLGFALLAALLAAVQRETPHPWNFVMIGALGVWSGARLSPWLGLLLPVSVWFLTDIIELLRTGYPSFNPFVAVGFLGYALLGLLLRYTKSPARIAAVCVLGSVQFFLLTNFCVWLKSSIDPVQVPEGRVFFRQTEGVPYPNGLLRYSANAEGLLACYAMAVPFHGQDPAGEPVVRPLGFLGNLLVGDLLFAGLLFGSHALVLSLTRRRALAWREPS